MWTGIGNGYLGQDGSEQGLGGMQANELWYEVVPSGGGMVGTSLAGAPGYLNIAITNYLGGERYEFQLYTAYTKQWAPIAYANNPYGGNSGESIVERPEVNKALTALLDYNYVKMSGSVNSDPLAQWPHKRIDMYNGLDLLAETGPLAANGAEFTNTQVQCS